MIEYAHHQMVSIFHAPFKRKLLALAGVVHSIVSRLKGYTSNTLRAEFPSLKSRLPTLWTKGKFISSVGSVLLETVKKYIEDQKGV